MDRCYRREYFHFFSFTGFYKSFSLTYSVARISSPGKGVN